MSKQNEELKDYYVNIYAEIHSSVCVKATSREEAEIEAYKGVKEGYYLILEDWVPDTLECNAEES